MERLRCGTIISKAFIDYVAKRFTDDVAQSEGAVLSISYLRCAEGKDQGQMWWQENWLPKEVPPAHELFKVGAHTIRLNKRSQQGLKERYIDVKNDAVAVS